MSGALYDFPSADTGRSVLDDPGASFALQLVGVMQRVSAKLVRGVLSSGH